MMISTRDETLEHVEQLGFYWVLGILAVGAVGLAGLTLLAFEALRGVAALLTGI
jgi:hypothetical protein